MKIGNSETFFTLSGVLFASFGVVVSLYKKDIPLIRRNPLLPALPLSLSEGFLNATSSMPCIDYGQVIYGLT